MDQPMNQSMNQPINQSMNQSMDISMNQIDNITLKFFANKLQYDYVLKKNELFNNNAFYSDKKFYKKRVIDLTKKLFRNEIEDLQLYDSFNCYIKSCINHLKFIDKKDIIQEKYTTILDNSCNNSCDNSCNNSCDNNDNSWNDNSWNDNSWNDNSCNSGNDKVNECDILFANQTVKKINLDTFVIKKKQKEKTKIFPKKEIINIKTKEHKTKGLKKKNINNIYEEPNKKEK